MSQNISPDEQTITLKRTNQLNSYLRTSPLEVNTIPAKTLVRDFPLGLTIRKENERLIFRYKTSSNYYDRSYQLEIFPSGEIYSQTGCVPSLEHLKWFMTQVQNLTGFAKEVYGIA